MTFETLIDRLIDLILGRVRYHGFYLYRVASDDHGKTASLLRVGDVQGLEDIPDVSKLYGSHGLTCESADGQLVLVGFEGGDPGKPYVAFYFPDTKPKRVTIDASELVQVTTTNGGGAGGGGPSDPLVQVGSTNRKAVARVGDGVNNGMLGVVYDSMSHTLTFNRIDADGVVTPWFTIADPAMVVTPLSSGGFISLNGKVAEGSAILSSQ